jgi:hypothetical protein
VGFDRLLEELLPPGREEISWATMAAVLVIARLCEPSSELHVAEDWFRRTALGDVLGIAEEKVNDDRLYRALDKLLPHKQRLERHVQDRLGTLFQLDYELLLYDVTSTYFEGEARSNPLAARGYSRDHRPDCKQVCIGLVVTSEGYPLGYEVFAGNRNDVTTLQEIVARMESCYGRMNRIWALDRGMVSEANIERPKSGLCVNDLRNVSRRAWRRSARRATHRISNGGRSSVASAGCWVKTPVPPPCSTFGLATATTGASGWSGPNETTEPTGPCSVKDAICCAATSRIGRARNFGGHTSS